MNPQVGFPLFLLSTLVLLGCAIWSGFAHRRRLHLTLVVAAVAGLGVTIFYAERLGRLYDLEAAGAITPVHLFIAKLTTLAYLLPIASGIRLWFRPGGRALHRSLAFLVLGLTALTAVTGTAMILMAERRDSGVEGSDSQPGQAERAPGSDDPL